MSQIVLGQNRRRRGQAEARQQQVGLVLVIGRASDLRGGHKRGQAPIDASAGKHLDVQVRQRQHRAHIVLRAQVFESRDVAGIVDQRNRSAYVRGVLGGRQRRGVGDDGRGEPGEAGDDVVALAHAGQQDRGAVPSPARGGSAGALAQLALPATGLALVQARAAEHDRNRAPQDPQVEHERAMAM